MRTSLRKTASFFAATGFLFLLILPLGADAQKAYEPFVVIPGFEYGTTDNLPDLINRLYIMLIVAGSVFAVVKLVLAGITWSMSDNVSKKHDVMHDIQGLFLGLAILLAPAIVLNTINSDLTNLNILSRFGGAVGGVDLSGPAKSSQLPANMQQKSCVPKSNDPADIEACFVELNCPAGAHMQSGINREGDAITCNYIPSRREASDTQDTCRMSEDTPEERSRCYHELSCFNEERNGEISIQGKAMVCTYAPEYKTENCDIDADTTKQQCIDRCTEREGASVTKGNELGSWIECKYIAN